MGTAVSVGGFRIHAVEILQFHFAGQYHNDIRVWTANSYCISLPCATCSMACIACWFCFLLIALATCHHLQWNSNHVVFYVFLQQYTHMYPPPSADITKTCYDVRLGAEHCRVPFPRAVSSGCCFAFSVLKRTYYVYSPTAAEAKRWVESITSVSAILNRRQAAFESSMPPLTSLPSSERKMKPNRRYRAAGTMAEEPRPGPEASARASKHYRVAEAAESQYTSEPEEKPNDLLVFTQKPAHYKRPTHDNSESKSPIQYKRSVPDSKLWLDGSPSPQFGHESSLSQPISTSPPPEPQNPLKYRAHGAMFSSCDHNLHLRGMPLSSSSSESPVFRGGAILPRPVIKRKASDQPLPTAALALHFQRLQHREAVIRRGLAKMEHPRRPTSVDFTTSLPHSYYLPSRLQFSAQTHGRNTAENLARPGRRRSGDRIPPIVKPKPILRSPKGSLPPIRQEDLATATHGSQASAKESDNSVSGNAADLAYLRYHHSRSRSSPGLITMASLIESPDSPTSELPLTFIPPPPLTAPPPSRPPPPSPPDSPPPPKESPDSPISELPLKFMPPPPVTAPPPSRPPPPSPPNSPPPPNVLEFLDPPPPVGPATPQADESSKEPAADWQLRTSERRSPLTKEREANNWALNELRKVS